MIKKNKIKKFLLFYFFLLSKVKNKRFTLTKISETNLQKLKEEMKKYGLKMEE